MREDLPHISQNVEQGILPFLLVLLIREHPVYER